VDIVHVCASMCVRVRPLGQELTRAERPRHSSAERKDGRSSCVTLPPDPACATTAIGTPDFPFVFGGAGASSPFLLVGAGPWVFAYVRVRPAAAGCRGSRLACARIGASWVRSALCRKKRKPVRSSRGGQAVCDQELRRCRKAMSPDSRELPGGSIAGARS